MLNIYLTNLGKYNEGELLGEWVELPIIDEELNKVFDRIQICHDNIVYTDECGTPYEEYFITDYETDINGLEVGEYSNLDKLNEIAKSLEDLDEHEKEVVKVLLGEGYELTDAMEKKDDCMIYYNCNDMEDVAREYVEQVGLLNDIPSNLQNYFDFESFGRDMSFEGHYVFTDNGNCVQILWYTPTEKTEKKVESIKILNLFIML